MKKIIIFSAFILYFTSNISAQIFQKITNQPLVQDGAYGSGCAWGDYNNDGKLDLIVTSYNDFGNSSYPLLYKNMGNGNFAIDNSSVISTNTLYQTLSCAWADYNHDGKIDLLVTTGFNQDNLLYKNLGNGNFTRITSGNIVNDPGHSGGVNWIDYNKDGYLDVLIVQHGYNSLYKGNPDGSFTKITDSPIVTDNGTHRRAMWGDYDNDGYPDLFVCNFNGEKNNLYHNNRNGTFTKITEGAIVNDISWGSGCAWGDYNNDGWLDLYVTNGGGGPNFLYKNNHDGTFTRVLDAGSIVTDTDAGFGCNWGDVNNDGYLDMFVANNYNQHNALYINNGNGHFTKLATDITCTDIPQSSVGSAFGDYNNDGKLDLFVVNQGYNQPPQNDFLYKNIGANDDYLEFRLLGGGIGSRVTLRIGNYIAIREVSGGNGCSSQDMPWVHFGLGFLGDNSTATVDSVRIDWNDGFTQTLNNVPINQQIDVNGIIGISHNTNEVPKEFSLSQNYPNPFNPTTTIEYSILKASNVKLTVFDVTGRTITTLVDTKENSGNYKVDFNASDIPSGVYFYKIQTEEFTNTKKMILIK